MAMFLLLFLALPIFIIIFLLRRRNSSHPPGPKGLPFIGNIHQIDISKPHIWLTELSYKYGPLVFLKICGMPLIVISSADVAEKALKHNDVAFAGRPITFTSTKLTYDNSDIITTGYSDYWREMRKMVAHHLFSHQKLLSYRPIRKDEISSMIDAISKRADLNQPIDIGQAMSIYNCNILCRIAFGKKLVHGTQSWRRFDTIIRQFSTSLYKAFFIDRFVFGWINKISGATRRLEKIFENMDSFHQELIDEHLDPDRPNSMTNDILDLLIQLREDKSAAVKIDWKHIKAIVMNVFLAGTDTTGMTLLWAMTALMKNPSAMKKVQQEIRSVVKTKRLVDEDDIENLPYLKAVVKETLRLYPVVPLVPKETIETCILDGYKIEAKTFVLVNIWAIGRDPKYWKNADEFLPERFLNTRFNFIGKDFEFIPFGSGRRICLGPSLAVANMEVALANLFYLFNWKIPNGKREEDIDNDATVGLSLHKKNPLYLLAKTYM